MKISEMVCDAMGKMNAFATEETSTVAGEVGQFLRDLRKAAKNETLNSNNGAQDANNEMLTSDNGIQDSNNEAQAEGQKNSAPEDVKHSRELTTDGRVVAVVDEDILSNLDLDNWNQETKKAAQKAATEALLKFQDGIAVEGITREVTRRSRREFTRSEYTEQLFRERNTAFADKMRAANNLDDVVIATTDWARDGKLKHPRTDNFVDFDHGTTLIASGDAKYEAEVVVGITDKGAAVFYDIVNMQPGNFSIKNEEPSTTATTNKSPGDIHEGSSEARVAQQEQNVKQKYSRELDSEYMELAEDPEGNSTELRKMVDQAAEQQGYKTLFYHGSKKGGGFTEFRDWQYFTPKKEYAERYAQRGNPDSLYSVFVKMENPFDTRNAKARRIFQKARGELGLSEIQGTGLPDWTDGYDLAGYIDENGLNYDAIVLDEGGDLVNGKPVSRGLSYVVRKSNQVKSADAVVYDDNGKVIPLSERFNSDKRDIRYSRELTTDGRIVAVVDEDILSNLDLSNWNQETKEAAQKAAAAALLKFQDGIAVEGITRKVNRISRKEFTRSEYTNELFWWNSTAFLDKMRAANNLDDVVIATTDWARDGKLKHPRTDNFVDFDHGTTLIASGDAKYEAEVVVGITDKGDAVFYDIVNMKQGDFSIKKEESSPTATTNKSPGSIFEDSSKKNVAQQSENVKQKYSRELETVEELQRQNELLQEQRDYWRGQTEVTGRAATKWQIRALANQLMRRYHSQTEVDEIVPELEWLVKNVTKADWDISYADITNAAEAVAASVVGGSGANYNADQWGTGQEIKDFLRQNAIKADEALTGSFQNFSEFEQRNKMLKFNEKGKGTEIGKLWTELQNRFGMNLFPDSITSPGDQLRHIADTVSEMTAVSLENPYDLYMELTARQIANDVIAGATAISHRAPTKADQAVERATEELNRLLKAGRTRERARIEQNQQTTYRQQIKNVSEKFQRMLLRPGKGATQHAPANLVGAVRSFCELFNDSEMRQAARWQLTLDTFFNYVCGCI